MGPLTWLALSLAVAAPDDPALTWRWRDADPAVVVVGPDGTRGFLVEAPADVPWRMRCPGGAPTRTALTVRADGTPSWWTRDDDQAVAEGDAFIFEALDDGPGRWVLDRRCDIRWATLVTDPRRLDQLERAADGAQDLRERASRAGAFTDDPAVTTLLDPTTADGWWGRYAALRPVGAFVRRGPPVGPSRGRRVQAELGPGPGPDGWHVDADTPWRVSGPWQVEVEARVLDVVEGEPACVVLAGDDGEVARACQPVAPRTTLEQEGAGLIEVPRRWEGQTVSRRLTWRLSLPRGTWSLALDRPALARVRRADITPLRRVAPLPESPVLLAVPPEPPVRWTSAEATVDAEVPRLVLAGPSSRPADQPDDVSWVPLDDVPPEARWLDADGRLQLLLEGDDICTVRWPEVGWTTADLGRVHTFVVADPTSRPTLEGCDGLARVEGPLPGDLAREVVVEGWVAAPDLPAPLRLEEPEGIDTDLLVYLPGHMGEARLTITTDGRTHRHRLLAAQPDPTHRDLGGGRWQAPVRVPLPRGADLVTVQSSVPVVVRPVRPDEGDPTAPGGTSASSDPLSRVHDATIALADTRDPARRARLLSVRSAALLEAGRPDLAWRDLASAAALDPDVTSSPAGHRARAALLALLYPNLPALPVDGTAVREGPHAEERALRAREGRFTALARFESTPADAARWWLEAARTQVPDRRAPLEAFAALTAATGDVDHPGFAALRAWSRWERVPTVEGSDEVITPWPQPPPDATEEALYVDAWQERRLELGRGWSVLLPAADAPHAVEVRCRPRDASEDEPCTVQRVDTAGAVLGAWTLDADGASHALALPPRAAATRLEAVGGDSHHVQVRLPTDLTGGGSPRRRARRLRGGGGSVTVLGPSVVEVEAWSPRPGRLRLRGAETVEVALGAEPTVARVPVEEGTRIVTLDAPPDTLVQVRVRVPGGRPLEPLAHGRLLRSMGQAPDSVEAQAVTGSTATLRTAATLDLPRHRGAWSLLGDARFGFGTTLADPETALRAQFRATQEVVVRGRPTPDPIWLDGAIALREVGSLTPVLRARFGGEGWWRRGVGYGWLGGDLELRTPTGPGLPVALLGRGEVGFGVDVHRMVALRAILSGGGSGRFGAYDPADPDVPDTLWTLRRETHPTWADGELQLRVTPTPWLRVRARGWLMLNTHPDRLLVDSWRGVLDLRGSAPSVYGLLGVGWWQRTRDRDRDAARGTVDLHATFRGTLWVSGRTALQLEARVAWWPQWGEYSAHGGLRVQWLGKDARAELRPSRHDAVFAERWNQPGRWVSPPTP